MAAILQKNNHRVAVCLRLAHQTSVLHDDSIFRTEPNREPVRLVRCGAFVVITYLYTCHSAIPEVQLCCTFNTYVDSSGSTSQSDIVHPMN
uniref:Uncharacterized protein n=1 Tax=Panagrellus redivivus TaxID=6233 RepID=A0A7E4W1U1_PANRE